VLLNNDPSIHAVIIHRKGAKNAKPFDVLVERFLRELCVFAVKGILMDRHCLPVIFANSIMTDISTQQRL
jgi:hypothetical protein